VWSGLVALGRNGSVRSGVSAAALLLSSAVLAAGCHGAYYLLHRYDWEQPFIKLACFEFLVLLILASWFGVVRKTFEPPPWVSWVEIAIASAVLSFEVWRAVGLIRVGFHTPMNDIGDTTDLAARLYFLKHKNPYSSRVAPIWPDRNYQGYKYGPGMIFGYALSAAYPNGDGIKFLNVLYLGTTVGLLARLAAKASAERGRLSRIATALIASALTLLPERLYHEAFDQGAIDLFPVMLIVLGLLFIEKESWFLAGLALGFSFVTKFSPAVFLVVLLFRRRTSLRLVAGLALGLLPCVPFVFWNHRALLRNVVLFHGMKGYDSTSLYNLTPKELQWVFPKIQLLALAVFVAANFFRPIAVRSLVAAFTVLLVIIEVSFTEMHGNHVIWFIPFVAVLVAWHRHGLATVASLALPYERRELERRGAAAAADAGGAEGTSERSTA
jgi:hypothetical protein